MKITKMILAAMLLLTFSAHAGSMRVASQEGEVLSACPGTPVFFWDKKIAVSSIRSLVVYEVKPNPRTSRWVLDDAIWALTAMAKRHQRIAQVTWGKTPAGMVSRGQKPIKPGLLYGVELEGSGYDAKAYFGYQQAPTGECKLTVFQDREEAKRAFGFFINQ